MYLIIDNSVLLLYCMLSLQFCPVTPSFVLACFSALSAGSLLLAFPETKVRQAIFLVCAVLFFPLPECGFFLPLLLYNLPLPSGKSSDRSGSRSQTELLSGLCLASALAFHLLSGGIPSAPVLLFTAAGCSFSLLLRHRTAAYTSLLQKYRRTRDDDTEIQLLLKERNQSLVEKQDSELYAATLRERNRIAREIHDNVGHMLTRSILIVGALKAVHREPELSEPLGQLNDTLNQAMNSIRQSVHDLHDSTVNLQEALQTLTRDFTFCPVRLSCDIRPDIPRNIKYSFISIAKEALVNISRHSNATEASITAVEHPGFYQFIVEDNGTRASASPEDSGIGLYNMQSRVDALRGNLRFQTEKGFRIYITVPKRQNPESPAGTAHNQDFDKEETYESGIN